MTSPNPDPSVKRKPFASWVKRIAKFKGSDEQTASKKAKASGKHKKSNTNSGNVKNNPYPESGPLRQRDQSPATSNGQLSFATPTSRPQDDGASYGSIPNSRLGDGPGQSNKSGAPTLATNADTTHSDAGHSKAATSTTRGGALSSTDGAGPNSTFSSPNPSERSLTTTLTTIQSQSTGNALQNGVSGHQTAHHHGMLNNPNGNVMFSHQYPASPAPSNVTASAIPRHVAETMPNTYSAATANNLLSDNASILTLASSSKRRRRSMDTDASVRALPPSSVWGGSRESLPLSVLSGNADSGLSGPGGLYSASQSRPSIGGIASTERASIYSSQGVSAPALASERNSFYSHKPGAKDLADAKSLRSITNIDVRSQYDARSINEPRNQQYDAKSINDAKSQLGDVASLNNREGSLRNYEGSMRSGGLGHSRNDSISGSIGSPLASPGLRQPGIPLSRRSSDWQEVEEEDADGVERNGPDEGADGPDNEKP